MRNTKGLAIILLIVAILFSGGIAAAVTANTEKTENITDGVDNQNRVLLIPIAANSTDPVGGGSGDESGPISGLVLTANFDYPNQTTSLKWQVPPNATRMIVEERCLEKACEWREITGTVIAVDPYGIAYFYAKTGPYNVAYRVRVTIADNNWAAELVSNEVTAYFFVPLTVNPYLVGKLDIAYGKTNTYATYWWQMLPPGTKVGSILTFVYDDGKNPIVTRKTKVEKSAEAGHYSYISWPSPSTAPGVTYLGNLRIYIDDPITRPAPTPTPVPTPPITVLYPNGEEQLKMGATHNIVWKANPRANQFTCAVDLYQNQKGGENLVLNIVANYPVVSEYTKYPWTISDAMGLPKGDYKILVRCDDGLTTYSDMSDGYFNIVPMPIPAS